MHYVLKIEIGSGDKFKTAICIIYSFGLCIMFLTFIRPSKKVKCILNSNPEQRTDVQSLYILYASNDETSYMKKKIKKERID
jgi:hypothetical protein